MIMPYLNFNGDCEEAFRLYQRAFGGQEPVFARYGEGPDDPEHPMDEVQKAKIMHGFPAYPFNRKKFFCIPREAGRCLGGIAWQIFLHWYIPLSAQFVRW